MLFRLWYNKMAMGYDEYSMRVRGDGDLINAQEVMNLFTITVAPHGIRLAEELLRLDEITEKTLGTIVPVIGLFTRSILQILYNNRAVHLVERGKRDSYEKTPAFTNFLKQYVSNEETMHSILAKGGRI
jgi:transcription initiation factor IIE alpha subunit